MSDNFFGAWVARISEHRNHAHAISEKKGTSQTFCWNIWTTAQY